MCTQFCCQKLTLCPISQLPDSHLNEVPYSVSVVENECDRAKNNLLVTYNPLSEGVEKKKKFAVCVKVARWQNLIPSFPWIASGWRAGEAQSKERKGSNFAV